MNQGVYILIITPQGRAESSDKRGQEQELKRKATEAFLLSCVMEDRREHERNQERKTAELREREINKKTSKSYQT